MAKVEDSSPAQATIKATEREKKSPCQIERATEPCAIVIFGASGDLTKRKLIPSLFRLYINGLLPSEFLIVGTGRKDMGNDAFRDKMKKALGNDSAFKNKENKIKEFLSTLYYEQLDYSDLTAYEKLSHKLKELESEGIPGGNRIYYLSTPPSVYTTITENLGLSHLSMENGGWRRIVIEKPFGRDLDSARALNAHIRHYFKENQIFRIDHYLGKETVQDILMFRFANSIFEPIWDRRYIDHVQITTAESIGIENRAGYYDKSGVMRDMFQNHMLQLVALTAMEPPAAFEADAVRDEKVKVLRSIRPIPLSEINKHLALGQYDKGAIDDNAVISYRDEEDIKDNSHTATYAAIKLYLDNWRWKGVPFYLRSGKRLARRKTEIAVQFRHVPHFMFRNVMEDEINPNTLVFTIQPDEGIKLTLQTKMPGTKVCLREVVMDFKYKDFYSGAGVDAYERVLIDCLEGDHTLFVREDGVDYAWKLLTPVLEAIESDPKSAPFEMYESGSQGPELADRLIGKDGRKWRGL
ncbi:MAG: glucose-6-phosphate dehydrogenase [Deltaproteobacteria bacterium]|nr:glucose-6-phosphate dehydrogenase [Deltaproteobacteria bacterium]